MEYAPDKVDEATLALLYLNLFEDRWGARAWKSMPWEAMNWLHEKGLDRRPEEQSPRSVVLTEEGLIAAEEALRKLFTSR